MIDRDQVRGTRNLRVLAVALTDDERALLVSALTLAEEWGADVEVTRPLAEMLENAIDLDDPLVREVLTV